MPDNQDSVNRRDFMVKTAAVAGAFGAAKELFAKPAKAAATGKVIGANDRINVGVIGVGGRGFYLAGQYAAIGERTSACKVVAVADVYEKRKRLAAEKFKCDGYLDYREIINRADIDAVVVATPDHWHAPIALEALDHGKDVYLEKPMCPTIEEARHLSQTVKETKRVLQVGSQTTSALQWHVAKKYIADGAIGDVLFGYVPLQGRSGLRADLQHALGLLHGLGEVPGLLDGGAHGLFQIYVLAMVQGLQRDGGMPVIGRGHHDGIDIRAVDDLAVVQVAVALELFGGQSFALFVDVGHSHHLAGAGALPDGGILAGQIEAASADADDAHVDAVVGADDPS